MHDGGTVVAGGIPLEEGEYVLRLVAADESASASLPTGSGVVAARHRAVTPSSRPRASPGTWSGWCSRHAGTPGCTWRDRIVLTVGLPDDLRAQLVPYEPLLAGETLATEVAWVEPAAGSPLTLGERPLSLAVRRAW